MTIRTVRLQLSRRKGFNLQETSRVINGLLAVNCSRPGQWGNLFVVGGMGLIGCNQNADRTVMWLDHLTQLEAVLLHRVWLARQCAMHPGFANVVRDTFGAQNGACWCGKEDPCHVDNYLSFARGTP